MTERRFYIPASEFSENIELDKEQSRHLARVLRLTSGDNVRVFDGNGRECFYIVTDIRRDGVSLRFLKETEPAAPESRLQITMAVPLLKKSNSELVLQKMVELGVTRFVPLICKRSEVAAERWKHDRASRIASEAAKQCGRAVVPRISEPVLFEEFIDECKDPAFFFFEGDGGSLPESLETDRVTALTGPEGGWDESEIDLAKQAGIRVIHLGGRILRAETAAIVAATLLQHDFGDLR